MKMPSIPARRPVRGRVQATITVYKNSGETTRCISADEIIDHVSRETPEAGKAKNGETPAYDARGRFKESL